MKRIRLHREEPSAGGIAAGVTLGALAGFVVGIVVAQRVGGLSGLTSRLRDGFDTLIHRSQESLESLAGAERDQDEYEYDEEYDEHADVDARVLDSGSALEERVLRAFRRDAILSERAIDIGAIGEGIIELSGWVETQEESEHAMAVTRTVPGIVTVVSRLFIGSDEQ
ncbi:MAG: BON domain-containing protein, partial [Gemmatimonas sp.]